MSFSGLHQGVLAHISIIARVSDDFISSGKLQLCKKNRFRKTWNTSESIWHRVHCNCNFPVFLPSKAITGIQMLFINRSHQGFGSLANETSRESIEPLNFSISYYTLHSWSTNPPTSFEINPGRRMVNQVCVRRKTRWLFVEDGTYLSGHRLRLALLLSLGISLNGPKLLLSH